MWAALAAARDALAAVDGVSTCRIGWESGISPADYPLVRLVPVRITPGRPYNNRTAEVLVVFGAQIGPSDTGGLQAVIQDLLTLEAALLVVLRGVAWRYIETLVDEERPDSAYKLMAIRCEIPGDAPGAS